MKLDLENNAVVNSSHADFTAILEAVNVHLQSFGSMTIDQLKWTLSEFIPVDGNGRVLTNDGSLVGTGVSEDLLYVLDRLLEGSHLYYRRVPNSIVTEIFGDDGLNSKPPLAPLVLCSQPELPPIHPGDRRRDKPCLICPIGQFCKSRVQPIEIVLCPKCRSPLALRNLGRDRKASIPVWLSGVPLKHCPAVRFLAGKCRSCQQKASRGESLQIRMIPQEPVPDDRVPRGYWSGVEESRVISPVSNAAVLDMLRSCLQ